MANTTNLGLPLIAGNNTADVPRDMNALANGIDGKVGKASGLATLDKNGKVPAEQLNIDTSGLATKVEVGAVADNLASHKADNTAHGLGTETLQTTAKTIRGAINEAFQFANDGKTAVADAVTAKGVPASPSDTFPTLATKIGQINTGKKFAKGTASAVTRSGYQGYWIRVTGLDFLPNTVVAYGFNSTSFQGGSFTDGDPTNTSVNYQSGATSTLNAYFTSKSADDLDYVEQGGFWLRVATKITYTWKAYE